MTLRECYALMGADYEGVIGRLLTEERLMKFLRMLLKNNSFANLKDALEQQNYDNAFLEAHTLKGIALNLGLTRLASASDALTEALRPRQASEEIAPLFAALEPLYLEMERLVGALLEEA